MQYQQTYSLGKTSGQFQRDCVARYTALSDFCKQYTRPFTVFDLGCNMGYFGFRLADDFDCVSILADTKEISSLCAQNRGRFIWLRRRFSSADLKLLSQCEHFDVVIAFNVFHHFPDWEKAASATLSLGDHIFVEIPAPDDPGTRNEGVTRSMYDWFMKRGEVIGWMPSHVSGKDRPTLKLKGTPGISLKFFDAEKRQAGKSVITVESGFDRKTITIDRPKKQLPTEHRDFIPGMNLWNAHHLDCAHPRKLMSLIDAALKDLRPFHDDTKPWNFILDGKVAHPIDRGFKGLNQSKWTEHRGLKECKELLND